MDADDIVTSLSSFSDISTTHINVGLSNILASNKQYKSLFVNRRLPENGWSDLQIQKLLFTLSCLDTNSEQPIRCTLDDVEDENNATGRNLGPMPRWVGVGKSFSSSNH